MTACAEPSGGRTVPGWESLAVRLGAALLGIYALWRATLGVDLSDGAHVVALARRMANGDQPFDDEMNLQALGSLPAVPFTWAWTALFGTSGLVLASRILYVCVAGLAVWVAYRALRTGFRPAIAAVGAAAPLLAPAYNLLVVSYNTMPLLGLVVGSAAGYATIRTRRASWAAVSAAAVAVGVACYPPLLAGGGLLLLLVLGLTRSRRVLLGVLGGGAAVAVPVALYYFWIIGPDAVRATLEHSDRFLEARLTPAERVERTWSFYGDNIWRRRYWPALGMTVLAVVPGVPARWRAAGVGMIPVLVVAGSMLSFGEVTPAPFGRVTAVNAVVICALLLTPVTVFVVGRARQDLGRLLVLTLPPSLVQAGIFLLSTWSGPAWGVPYIGLAPLFLAITVGWLSIVEHGHRIGPVIAGTSLVLALGLLLALKPFRDPYPWDLGGRVTSGPFAGLSTTELTVASVDELEDVLDASVRPDQGLLVFGNSGAYLFTDARPVTPMLWLASEGQANQFIIDGYFDHRSERPDVVLVHENQVRAAGGWGALEQQDPFIAWLRDGYVTDPDQRGPFYLLTPAPTQGVSAR